jgi:fructoselysine-6-P-deglycase FrlB-like protein
MDDHRRDPDAPLPAAPDPWAGSEMPSRRDGPPFHMTDMIEAEPALAARLLQRLAVADSSAARLAAAVRSTASLSRPILVTGCGTSEHAALAVVEILGEALRDAGEPSGLGQAGMPVAVQAFEASLDDELGGDGALVIGVSHEGGTWATNRALEAAKAAGATVALLTVSERSPGASIADIVVATDELDQSWCHTVGYVSPMLAAAAVAGHLTDRPIHAESARRLLSAGLAPDAVRATEALAAALNPIGHLIVSGTGVDRPAARELVLKVEEGAHLSASMRDLETVLHGHLAGMEPAMGFVLILTDPARFDDRLARASGVLRAISRLGLTCGAILGEAYAAAVPEALTPAGRLVVPSSGEIPAAAAALLGSAVPLQLLTERLARARGVNPDPIRRDDARYLAAADAAG